MKVVVDAFGGDNAPLEVVEGAIQAIKGNKEYLIPYVDEFVKNIGSTIQLDLIKGFIDED